MFSNTPFRWPVALLIGLLFCWQPFADDLSGNRAAFAQRGFFNRGGRAVRDEAAELRKRLEEIRSELQARAEWVIAIGQLAPDQQARMGELVTRYAESPAAVHQAASPPASPPPYYRLPVDSLGAGLASARSEFDNEVRQQVLTPEQLARFDAACAERRQIHRIAYRNLFLVTLDRELFLTANQRERLSQIPRPDFLGFDEPPQATLSQFRGQFGGLSENQALRTELTDEQWEVFRAMALTSEQFTVTVTNPLPDGPDGEVVTDLLRNAREAQLRIADLQIACLRAELSFTEAQANKLRTAAKGVVVTQSEGWLSQLLPRADKFTRTHEVLLVRDGLGPVFAQVTRAEALQNHLLWQAALREVLGEEPHPSLVARENFHRAALVEAVTMMLDDAIWLSPDQREPLRRIVSRAMPAKLHILSRHESHRDPACCAAVLLAAYGPDELQFLSEKQRADWQLLANSYPSGKDPRRWLEWEPTQADLYITPALAGF